MDKSSGQAIHKIKTEFARNISSVIICSEPSSKSAFLEMLIGAEERRTILVDLDLLYSGYVESGMIPGRGSVTVFRPEKESWSREIAEVISTASAEGCLVIVDSLNGIHVLHDDIESARFVNACLMLLSSMGAQAGSCVVVTAVARKRDGSWVLAPGGRQIPRAAHTRLYLLDDAKTPAISRLDDPDEPAAIRP